MDYKLSFAPLGWLELQPGASFRSMELEFNGDAEHRYELGPTFRLDFGGKRIRAFTEAKLYFGSAVHYTFPMAGLRLGL
jgi:hypothetical protein